MRKTQYEHTFSHSSAGPGEASRPRGLGQAGSPLPRTLGELGVPQAGGSFERVYRGPEGEGRPGTKARPLPGSRGGGAARDQGQPGSLPQAFKAPHRPPPGDSRPGRGGTLSVCHFGRGLARPRSPASGLRRAGGGHRVPGSQAGQVPALRELRGSRRPTSGEESGRGGAARRPGKASRAPGMELTEPPQPPGPGGRAERRSSAPVENRVVGPRDSKICLWSHLDMGPQRPHRTTINFCKPFSRQKRKRIRAQGWKLVVGPDDLPTTEADRLETVFLFTRPWWDPNMN
ncbi:translation initiation factor IF-2-like [Choloepus didactylus]|uniref:translation initiation factor IF-2-like n=1 Tax=Choloepus didactylus TaxID=27675 RepID=UPI00189F4BCF|nr:translation initiation factor IF-2-like [Choloepus didactylus]